MCSIAGCIEQKYETLRLVWNERAKSRFFASLTGTVRSFLGQAGCSNENLVLNLVIRNPFLQYLESPPHPHLSEGATLNAFL